MGLAWTLLASAIWTSTGCSFSADLGKDYLPCGEDGTCKPGCVCLDGKVCVPEQPELGPEACGSCRNDGDCSHGCLCVDFECVPPVQTAFDGYCETGPECLTADDCGAHGCQCEDYQCVPPEETDYPDWCKKGPPECDSYHPCLNAFCSCVEFACRPPDDGFDPAFCMVPAECAFDTDCPFGCRCSGSYECEPAAGFSNRDCSVAGQAACGELGDCRLGCECVGGRCVRSSGVGDITAVDYCSVGASPTCMKPDLVVDTTDDTVDDHDGKLSLREALQLAAGQNGPHRIAFAVREVRIESQLPPVPSLTYIDGGEGVRILPRSDAAFPGLVVTGTGVAISDMEIKGFEVGIRISGARDVHLFRLVVGDSNLPNNTGVFVENSERVFLGRGRELECIGRRYLGESLLPDDLTDIERVAEALNPELDVNLIVYNTSNGLFVVDARQLFVYGTWIGFDNRDGSTAGNGGTGIVLKNVSGAVLGAQRIDRQELLDRYSYHVGLAPAAVAVGANGNGGVLVEGGGDIHMAGLLVGDTPYMEPFEQNEGFGLSIRGNTGPVFFGPDPTAEDYMVWAFGMVHTESAVAVSIENNLADVWLRRVQIQCFDMQPLACEAPCAVRVSSLGSNVQLVHLSILDDFSSQVILVEGENSGQAVLRVANNMFLDERNINNASVMSIFTQVPPLIEMDHNMMSGGFSSICEGCQSIGDGNFSVDGFDCYFVPPVPNSPSCQNVDRGVPIYIEDESGAIRPMNLTGMPGVPWEGCGPDIGAFECMTGECPLACHD